MDCIHFCCFGNKIYDWQSKEANYIHQLKQLQTSLSETIQQFTSLQEYHQNEIILWQNEKLGFLEKINELQNELHQKEVVTQQYKVYEDNFRQERQQIQDLLASMEKMKLINTYYEMEVKKLNEHITSYRNMIELLGTDVNKKETVDNHLDVIDKETNVVITEQPRAETVVVDKETDVVITGQHRAETVVA